MNINSIDLNLFLVFQAIYATRSVTLAGDRLGMTQSAVSNALKRMRERFNDALFVRSADGMVPTPVRRAPGRPHRGRHRLPDAGRRPGPDLRAARRSNRTFRIAVNDIGQLVMMPELLSVARGLAPGVRFETVDVSVADARQRMLHGQIDIALGSWEPMGPVVLPAAAVRRDLRRADVQGVPPGLPRAHRARATTSRRNTSRTGLRERPIPSFSRPWIARVRSIGAGWCLLPPTRWACRRSSPRRDCC